MSSIHRVIGLTSVLLMLSACGGGGSGDGGSGGGTQPTSFTVSTTTTGTGSGTISPTSRSVTQGSTTSFTISPAAGSTIASVSGCGGSLSGTTYTTGPISTNCVVTATFEILARVEEYCVTNAVELEAAFAIAGKSSGKDIIRLAAAEYQGNFRFDIEAVADVVIEGGFDATCSMKQGASEAVLDGMSNDVVLVVLAQGGGSIEVSDLTIKNGRNTRNPGLGAGMYIYGPDAFLSITDIKVQANDGSPYSFGGGLRVEVHHAEITDSEFSDNVGYEGAGAYLICDRCEVRANAFVGNASSYYGGGLCVGGAFAGDFIIEANHFEANSAETAGGGLFSYAPNTLSLIRNTFENNSTGEFGFGGAVAQGGGTWTVSDLESNRVINNMASIGGGIGVSSYGITRLANNIVDMNSSSDKGGGLFISAYYDATSIIVVNNTIVRNQASNSGGGVSVQQHENSARVSMINNVISHNASPEFRNLYINNDENNDFIASPVEVSNNAFDGADTYGAEIGQPVNASNILIDASAYVDLAGGDYRPSAGSSLINAGTQTDGVPETDFTGFTRDAQSDIGAYEYRGN